MTQRFSSITLTVIVALGPAIALAQSSPERDGRAVIAAIEKMLVDTIANVEPSVVAISRAAPPQAQAQDSAERSFFVVETFGDLQLTSRPQPDIVAAGVIIDPAGLVLTEYLAVREGDNHTVTLTNGETYPAGVKAADPRSGLAVLAMEPTTNPPQRAVTTASSQQGTSTAFPSVRIGNADALRKGQFVIAIGNPYAIRTDGEPTVSWGTVTNLARKAPPGTNLNDTAGPGNDYRTTVHHLGTLIQTDAALGWSAGGGALVNFQRELIGLMTTASAIAGHEQPAGYAIPLNAAFRRIIDTLKEGREVEYGLLGVNLQMSIPNSGNSAESSVMVQHTYAGSPGARAGLKAGDVILGVDGRPVHNVDELQRSISLLPPSTETTIEYARGGVRNSTRVKLAKLGVPGNKIVSNRPPPWHGVRVDYATALDALQLGQAIEQNAIDPAGCVLITDVAPDSDAARAGIREGMFVSHVGGKRVTTPAEFYESARNVDGISDLTLTQPPEPTGANASERERPEPVPALPPLPR